MDTCLGIIKNNTQKENNFNVVKKLKKLQGLVNNKYKYIFFNRAKLNKSKISKFYPTNLYFSLYV